jgi:Gpi18-like mannosyltransferase
MHRQQLIRRERLFAHRPVSRVISLALSSLQCHLKLDDRPVISIRAFVQGFMTRFKNILAKDRSEDVLFATLCVALALALRLALFRYETYDFHNFLRHWYDHLHQNGFQGFKTRFSDYTPPYLYLLWLATYLPVPKLYAIKGINLPADFALAFVALLLVKLKYDRRPVWLGAFAAVLFAPTVFFNSAVWGQCDAIYTAFLLASLYCLFRQQPGRALLFFSFAFAVKLQAMFFFPLLFVLWARGEIPLKYFFLIPAVYIALCLPALLAGRPFFDLLTIYLQQTGTYSRLTSSAPNLYQWLPDKPEVFARPGLIFAVSLVAFLSYACVKSGVRWGNHLTLRLALASVLLVPFVLPHMHERYFYAADCIAIVYGFYFPRRFYVPIVVVTISLFSYLPFLFGDFTVIKLPHLALGSAVVLMIVLADLFRDLRGSPVPN